MSTDESDKGTTRTEEPVAAHKAPEDDHRWNDVLREIASGRTTTAVLSVFLAVVFGSLLIAATDEAVRDASKYFFAAFMISTTVRPRTGSRS